MAIPRRLNSGNRFERSQNRDVKRRSEEHTSELQSQGTISYAVFCLKKKIIRRPSHK